MRDRMRKFFTAVVFLLFLIILTIPAESQAAVRYNLIKDVTSQKAPEGQLVRVAGKKRYLLSSGAYLTDQWISIKGKIYHFNKDMQIPAGSHVREISIFSVHPGHFIKADY